MLPPLTQSLAGIAPQLRKLVAPVVEQVAQRLLQGQSTTTKPIQAPTLASQTNRSAGRDQLWTTGKKATTPGKLSVPAACRDCGLILEVATRQYCDACLPGYHEAQATAFSDAGRMELAELRAAGKDPSRGGQAKAKRGQKNRQHMQDQAMWETEHETETDPEVFQGEILPQLQGVSLRVMAKATGLSEQYCSLIRRGKYAPHRRHSDALFQLVNDHTP